MTIYHLFSAHGETFFSAMPARKARSRRRARARVSASIDFIFGMWHAFSSARCFCLHASSQPARVIVLPCYACFAGGMPAYEMVRTFASPCLRRRLRAFSKADMLFVLMDRLSLPPACF